jgi:metal-responsive CopG/Arc/MetJ family transcriptional regulator
MILIIRRRMVGVKQFKRKKIWFNCDEKLLIKFTKMCKERGLTRNKVIERIVREFMEAKKNEF